MCWPPGAADRRYAGVTHIDVTRLDEDAAGRIRDLVDRSGVALSGLGYYPNPLHPDAAHRRPEGVDDATVEALGKLSEALEAVEAARGHLYAFHRLSGTADLTLGDAVQQLGAQNDKIKNFDLSKILDNEFVQSAKDRHVGP